MELENKTKSCILSAALARFQRFGYSKTTMAEIAGDCGMSAANIYRYFENKLDIGMAIAMAFYTRTEEELRNTVERPGSSASEMLEDLVVEINRSIVKIIAESPMMMEMINDLSTKRDDLVFFHRGFVNRLLVQVLDRGVARGEFAIADIEKTADQIRMATVAFNVPPVVGMSLHIFPADRRERDARELVRFLVSAIKKG